MHEKGKHDIPTLTPFLFLALTLNLTLWTEGNPQQKRLSINMHNSGRRLLAVSEVGPTRVKGTRLRAPVFELES